MIYLLIREIPGVYAIYHYFGAEVCHGFINDARIAYTGSRGRFGDYPSESTTRGVPTGELASARVPDDMNIGFFPFVPSISVALKTVSKFRTSIQRYRGLNLFCCGNGNANSGEYINDC